MQFEVVNQSFFRKKIYTSWFFLGGGHVYLPFYVTAEVLKKWVDPILKN